MELVLRLTEGVTLLMAFHAINIDHVILCFNIETDYY